MKYLRQLIVLPLILLFSCQNRKANTSKFLFNNQKAIEIRDSLMAFKELSLKVFNSGNMKIEDTSENYNYYYELQLGYNNDLNFDSESLGNWNDFEKNKDHIFQMKQFNVLTEKEKNKLFSLLRLLNDNYINGIIYYYTGSKIGVFPYCEIPFFHVFAFDERFNKNIILENDFNKLAKGDQEETLEANLLTDKKEGLLLFMLNKEKYLAWVYGNYNKIPKEWQKATKNVFND